MALPHCFLKSVKITLILGFQVEGVLYAAKDFSHLVACYTVTPNEQFGK